MSPPSPIHDVTDDRARDSMTMVSRLCNSFPVNGQQRQPITTPSLMLPINAVLWRRRKLTQLPGSHVHPVDDNRWRVPSPPFPAWKYGMSSADPMSATPYEVTDSTGMQHGQIDNIITPSSCSMLAVNRKRREGLNHLSLSFL
jgi:hypothetical protein